MDDARARELLTAERERIEKSIAGLSSDYRSDSDPDSVGDPGLEQHIADRATELFDKELEEGHLQDVREQLSAIERAEQRLADGTYGRSIVSGDPIPDARLEAVPTAERTIEEQAAHERGGR
jgi:DnaK suppressor protein